MEEGSERGGEVVILVIIKNNRRNKGLNGRNGRNGRRPRSIALIRSSSS